jgi:hypothetical protein
MSMVRGLYRYPVKSMRGEALEEAVVGPAGLVGDRAYALVDRADGKIASAKNPRKWAGLLGFKARFVAEPVAGEPAPPVVITGPDGVEKRSDDPDVDAWLSQAVGRDVDLRAASPEVAGLEFEEVWPDIEGLAPQEFVDQTAVGREEGGDVVSALPAGLFAPPGSFFDLSVVHVLTTATLARLAVLEP